MSGAQGGKNSSKLNISLRTQGRTWHGLSHTESVEVIWAISHLWSWLWKLGGAPDKRQLLFWLWKLDTARPNTEHR